VVSRWRGAYDREMESRRRPVAVAAMLVLLSARASASAQPLRQAAPAKLTPRSLEPLQLAGSGFKRRERVRITVTPTGSEAVTKRLRAKRNGSFTATLTGVQACNGIEAAAVGRRGSRASFQFAAVGCPGF
jgi:hypothetical protein